MKEMPASLINATFVVLVKPTNGGKWKLLYPKSFATREDGSPILGPNVRRLLNVKEIAAKKGCSFNDAKKLRDNMPYEFLVDPTTPVRIREQEAA